MCVKKRGIVLVPSNHAYIIRRRNSYYYRRRIPNVLKHLFPQKEFIVSLKTSNHSDAKKLAYRYDSYFDNLISAEIVNMMKPPRPKNAIDLIIKETIDAQGNQSREVAITPEDIKACSESGMSPEQMQQFFTEIFEKFESNRKKSNQTSSNTYAEQGVDNHMSCESEFPLLSELVKHYHDDLKAEKHDPNWKPLSKHQTFFRRLVEIIGDKPINLVTRNDAKIVRRKLKELPANTAKFRGCTVDEIINKRIADEETFSEKTINDHLELYNRLFSWSRREIPDYKNDPFFEIRVKATKKEKANKKRFSFNRDELKKIFSTDLYVNHDYDSRYQFWTPLIALYTGARRAEIAALYKEDVYQIDNVWVFDFNENSPDKRVKTLNGIRRTPIHSHLIELGFLTYYASCNNDSRLFTDLDHYTEKEGYGRKIGDWFNRDYLKKLGIYVKIKKVFLFF